MQINAAATASLRYCLFTFVKLTRDLTSNLIGSHGIDNVTAFVLGIQSGNDGHKNSAYFRLYRSITIVAS